MVEHLTFNQTVAGSSPPVLTITFHNSLKTQTKHNSNINLHWSLLYYYIYVSITESLHYNISTTALANNLAVLKQLKYVARKSYLTPSKPNLLHRSVWQFKRERIVETFLTPLKVRVNSIYKSDVLRLFSIYLTFANGGGDTSYVIHSYWKSFFITGAGKHQAPYIDPAKLVQKWSHSYNLLFNLFFNQSNFLTFSNKTLKEESCAFNWTSPIIHSESLRYSTPFFWLKNNPYGSEMLSLYTKVSDRGLEAAFITDIRYHRRTLFFLRKCGVYTMGIIPYTTNPWLVHYPFPVSSSTLFTQYFFLKFVIYIKRKASYHYFAKISSYWLSKNLV